MKGVSREEMREIDRCAIEEYGISAFVLMENAGCSAASVSIRMLKRKEGNKKISLVSGKGNNGGDGLVCARHLINKGYKLIIYLLGKREEIKSELTMKNLQILERMEVEIREISDFTLLLKFQKDIEESELILDAIFGIGLSGEVKGLPKKVIQFLNQSNRPILSLDIPSGLDANSGSVLGSCIVARETITFGLPKRGFFLKDGPRYVGRIRVSDIGIPQKILKG